MISDLKRVLHTSDTLAADALGVISLAVGLFALLHLL